MSPRIVELRRNVLDHNDRVAAALRTDFARTSTCAVNLVSSPGTGKTTLLTHILRQMHDEGTAVAALVGDCATDNDARKLAASGAPVRQIVTEGLCHLEAAMVSDHLADWDIGPVEFLFIENVGNLVCPASFDLGEGLRVVLLSVTEGEDKPSKYPQLFNSADMAIVTKYDLAEPCEFDLAAATASIEEIRPGMPLFLTSARDPATIAPVVAHLRAARVALRST